MGRLFGLLLAFVLSLGGILLRLSVLQVSQAGEYRALALNQRVHTLTLPATRGDILDRSREPLAISLDARDIYADPQLVADPYGTAVKLADLLDLKVRDLLPKLTAEGSTFEYIAQQVDLDLAKQVEALSLPGVGFLPVSKRYYPAGPLAPQVLGFVGVDGVGLEGLEYGYQKELAGRPGRSTEETDIDGRPIVGGVNATVPPKAGEDLVLTLDRYLQYQAQAALAEAVRANHAKGGTVIVMDPRTGDVLAMAGYPWFDPNRFRGSDPERFANTAVSAAFEPGSVNKTITAAAAVEEHAVSLQQRFSVPAQLRVDGVVIHDSHPHARERMTLGDIVAESSNIGIVQVAAKLGQSRFARYLAKFGFGAPTGVGFPGESRGILPPVDQWSASSMATIPFGQGIAVTPLQMASVYATIANGGIWVQPRLIRGTVETSDSYRPAPRSPSRRVVSEGTAQIVTQMLAYAVQYGTGENARIPGYQVAGKTGTARKPFVDRSGYSHRYVASFIGFLPASNPRVVIAVMIDEPSTVYGGIASAPLFQRVARYAIERLGIAAASRVPLPPHALHVP